MDGALPASTDVRELHRKIDHPQNILAQSPFAITVGWCHSLRYLGLHMHTIQSPDSVVEEGGELATLKYDWVSHPRFWCFDVIWC